MSQVWPLRTAFKGREEFRLPYYYPRKQRAAVRCDCSTEPAPLSGCPSMGELCPLQSALETCRKSIQLLGVYPSVPSPVEEELTGRGRRLVTFNLQLERSWIPGAPVWNTASVEPVMAMPSCFPDSSGLALPSLADLSFSLPASDRMSTSQTLMTIMHELAELHNCLRHPLCWPAGRGTSWLCWNLLHVSGSEAQLGVQPWGQQQVLSTHIAHSRCSWRQRSSTTFWEEPREWVLELLWGRFLILLQQNTIQTELPVNRQFSNLPPCFIHLIKRKKEKYWNSETENPDLF